MAVQILLLAWLLDVIQEVRSQLLLRRLPRVAIYVVIVVVNAFTQIKLKMRMHVFLGVLGEAEAALRHAVVEEGM